jgi:hypothetical protein
VSTTTPLLSQRSNKDFIVVKERLEAAMSALSNALNEGLTLGPPLGEFTGALSMCVGLKLTSEEQKVEFRSLFQRAKALQGRVKSEPDNIYSRWNQAKLRREVVGALNEGRVTSDDDGCCCTIS